MRRLRVGIRGIVGLTLISQLSRIYLLLSNHDVPFWVSVASIVLTLFTLILVLALNTIEQRLHTKKT
jgi:hypothetical protein